MRSATPGVALDTSNMRRYVRSFLRRAPGRPRLWGLDNYQDVNRRRSADTRSMLDTVPGKVWLTETNGIVKSGNSRQFRYLEALAALASHDDPERAACMYGASEALTQSAGSVWLLATAARPPEPSAEARASMTTGVLAAARAQGRAIAIGRHSPAAPAVFRPITSTREPP
jgi:hypothetical protein